MRDEDKVRRRIREGEPTRARCARAIFRHQADRKEARPIPLNSTWFHLIPVNSTSRPGGGRCIASYCALFSPSPSPPPMTNDRFSIPNSQFSRHPCGLAVLVPAGRAASCMKSPIPPKTAKNPQNHSNRLSMNHLPSMMAIFQSNPVTPGQTKNQSGQVMPSQAKSTLIKGQQPGRFSESQHQNLTTPAVSPQNLPIDMVHPGGSLDVIQSFHKLYEINIRQFLESRDGGHAVHHLVRAGGGGGR